MEKKRILVVDDDAEVRRATTRILKTFGLQIDAVPDREEAFGAVLGGGIALVVTDCDMRQTLDGVRLLRDMAAAGVQVPAILTSGRSFQAILKECLAVGLYLHPEREKEFVLKGDTERLRSLAGRFLAERA